MKAEVGQDAAGRWAWMVRDDDGLVVASGDDLPGAWLAEEAALNFIDTAHRISRRAAERR
ncbi:MAG: hypothetical protein WKF79_00515 [Nocardioides sp.]